MPPFPQIDDVDQFLGCMEALGSDCEADLSDDLGDDLSEADLALDAIDEFRLEDLEEQPQELVASAMEELEQQPEELEEQQQELAVTVAIAVDIENNVDSHFKAMHTEGGV